MAPPAKIKHIPSWMNAEDTKSLGYLISSSPKFLEALDQLEPEHLNKTEDQLSKEIMRVKENEEFPQTLSHLKIRFWEEYKTSIRANTRMNMEGIYFGVCHREYWDEVVLKNPLYLSWLVHPPVDELVLQKELIQIGMNKLREVFKAPIFFEAVQTVMEKQENGEYEKVERPITKINLPLVKQMHSILRTMQDRVHGSVLQRSEAKTTNRTLNVHATPDQLPPGAGDEFFDPTKATMKQLETMKKLLADNIGMLETAAKAEGEPLTLEAET